jgi:group I intron endonuclease
MKISIPHSSGVYIIECLKNKKIYLGSAANLQARMKRHWSDLRRGKHHNAHLQHAWDKYGALSFEFKVLEYCKPDEVLTREQHFLDAYQHYGRQFFNIAKSVTAPGLGIVVSQETRMKLSASLKGRIITPEARAKLSVAAKGRKRSPESIEKSAAGMRGIPKTPEHRHNISVARRKHYIATDPDGNEINVIGLQDFCKAHGLNATNMVGVANGRQQLHKGWKCRRVKTI